MTELINDPKRANEFTSLFDDKLKNVNVDFDTGGKVCSPMTIDTLRELKIYFKNPTSHYFHPVVEKSFQKLGSSFSDFFSFVEKEFQYVPELRRYFLRKDLYDDFSKHESEYFKLTERLDVLRDGFNTTYADFIVVAKKELSASHNSEQGTSSPSQPTLASIHLITPSLENFGTIFLVLDEQWKFPIRFDMKQDEETYIRKLYNLAYFVDVPGKRVNYDEDLTNDINNALFKRRPVVEYMKSHGFKKPTLVIKSGNILVLKNEVSIKTGLIKHDVPPEYRYVYTDKKQ